METSTRAAARDEAASQVRCDHALYRRANAFVDRALRADCALVHTPFQIAAAALLLASQVRDVIFYISWYHTTEYFTNFNVII